MAVEKSRVSLKGSARCFASWIRMLLFTRGSFDRDLFLAKISISRVAFLAVGSGAVFFIRGGKRDRSLVTDARTSQKKREAAGSRKPSTAPTVNGSFEFKRETPKSDRIDHTLSPTAEVNRTLLRWYMCRTHPESRSPGPFVKVRQETGGISIRSSLAGGAIN